MVSRPNELRYMYLVLQSGSVPVVVRSDPVVSPADSSGSHSSVGFSPPVSASPDLLLIGKLMFKVFDYLFM